MVKKAPALIAVSLLSASGESVAVENSPVLDRNTGLDFNSLRIVKPNSKNGIQANSFPYRGNSIIRYRSTEISPFCVQKSDLSSQVKFTA